MFGVEGLVSLKIKFERYERRDRVVCIELHYHYIATARCRVVFIVNQWRPMKEIKIRIRVSYDF